MDSLPDLEGENTEDHISTSIIDRNLYLPRYENWQLFTDSKRKIYKIIPLKGLSYLAMGSGFGGFFLIIFLGRYG